MFGSFTPSGSLSRTSLSSEVGVKTQMNGFVTTAVIAVGLMSLTHILKYLPRAILASIILRSAWTLVDISTAKTLWHDWKPYAEGGQKRDLVVWFVAFFLTIVLGALYGIFSAVIVALMLIVYDAATPQVLELGSVQSLGGLWRSREVWPEGRIYKGVMVVEFRGPLSFASAEWFQEALERIRTSPRSEDDGEVEVIVLHFGSVHDLDPTALTMLKELLTSWRNDGLSCIIADAKSRVRLLLEENFGDGPNQLLDQPAFMIALDDAVDLAVRKTKEGAQQGGGEPMVPRQIRRFVLRRATDV